MAALTLPSFLRTAGLSAVAGPVVIVLILAMMVLPLPPLALDMLFTFNIACAIMVLLVALNTVKPLDFAVFPTVLLVTTLLRLSLNVASTRVVLLEGHTGPDAAGRVIEAFGHFLVGGNYAVGFVVFVILVIINFVVITKGAGRIAEVSARFTLDAMPGKQMAIDADLNAGLIGEEEARRRRAAIAQEADFYGAMDGASKFVRGDAVAGLLIMLINIVGGLMVGIVQHGMDFSQAAQNYTLLTIGDGLVAQIPALVISTAAGVVVSRVSTDEDIAQQVKGQLFSSPQPLVLTAVILGVLGLVPGMPHAAFLLLAATAGAVAYVVARPRPQPVAAPATPAPEAQEASWDDVAPVDALGLEVGYRLIPLVDRGQEGELLRRIKALRRKFAQEVGFLPPAVHIRDNLELKPGAYRILLKGVEMGRGEAHPGMYLAIDPGRNGPALPGTPTRDPAFGLPATWIEAGLREQAQAQGYTVVDAASVIATHFNQVIRTHAAELLGRQEVQQLLEHLGRVSPKLIEDLVPKLLPLTTLQKVLQSLLEEGLHIRDMRTIVETLAEHAPRVQEPAELTALVRVALGRSIVQGLFGSASELPVIALDPELENLLLQAVQGAAPEGGFEPGLADALLSGARAALERQELAGHPPVLLVPPPLRPLLARFLRRALPQLKVLSHAEIPDSRSIRVTAVIGGRT
ncbi:MAG: flagellar biosynthesis protein FlhA [Azospira oryzae]|nr:MAG: flagellar biosynthesis protein FlhA [Azospira oryzae]PZP82088.1 MAG: flagellar biosynthesis protein FlhA [Azospira oryzae]